MIFVLLDKMICRIVPSSFGERIVHFAPQRGRKRREKCGGTRFLQKAGSPAPSPAKTLKYGFS
jgi:hypothetical protein